MFKAECKVPTVKAGDYLLRLQRHFAHKITVESVNDTLLCRFDCGEARLCALRDRLEIEASSPSPEGLFDIKDTIERHLTLFARAEQFSGLDWSH